MRKTSAVSSWVIHIKGFRWDILVFTWKTAFIKVAVTNAVTLYRVIHMACIPEITFKLYVQWKIVEYIVEVVHGTLMCGKQMQFPSSRQIMVKLWFRLGFRTNVTSCFFTWNLIFFRFMTRKIYEYYKFIRLRRIKMTLKISEPTENWYAIFGLL